MLSNVEASKGGARLLPVDISLGGREGGDAAGQSL